MQCNNRRGVGLQCSGGRNSFCRPPGALIIGLLVLCFTAVSASFGAASAGAGKGLEKGAGTAKEQGIRHDLLSVSFSDERLGWACGRSGTILHSSDGGVSWARQRTNVDYTLASIHFVNSKSGWAVGDGGTILHTEDGGQTWMEQKSPVRCYLMGVHFATPRIGWAVGERTTILHTADAGKTWQAQFADEDYILKSVSFADQRSGWAVGEYGLIYHTEDGGVNWKKQAGGFGISPETGEIEAGNILFGVVAINPRTAIAAGIDGYITKTTDGGASWKTIGKTVKKVHLFGLAQSDERVIVGGTSLLEVSFDGGNTFRTPQIQPEITYGWIYGISPKGKAGFVAVGKAGWIYRTDKAALAWGLSKTE